MKTGARSHHRTATDIPLRCPSMIPACVLRQDMQGIQYQVSRTFRIGIAGRDGIRLHDHKPITVQAARSAAPTRGASQESALAGRRFRPSGYDEGVGFDPNQSPNKWKPATDPRQHVGPPRNVGAGSADQ